MIEGADHHLWVTHAEEMKRLLRSFIQHLSESIHD